MLSELRVRDLGVIEDLTIVAGDGMTAITGETGAGKTLIVEAIELLVGGRSDPTRVRAGADEAVIEGRFTIGDDDVVVTRVVPASGRSRAYLGGRMASVTELAETGQTMVDLHGQHAHQSLLSPSVQRGALDAFAGVDLEPRAVAKAELRDVMAALDALGGDERARARELDLLRYQVDELRAARVEDPDEDEVLSEEESRLADAAAHRDAAAAAWASLSDDGGAVDAVAGALAALGTRDALAASADRLRAISTELVDVARELQDAETSFVDDPERLRVVQDRRQTLTALRRKYGASLADVIAFATDAEARLAELESHDERAAALDARRNAVEQRVADAEQAIGDARRAAASSLAAAVEARLPDLALGGAQFVVEVGEDRAGDDVSFLFSANAGEPVRLLS